MARRKKPRFLLALETSCDETSAAVLERGRILSNIILSQDEIHSPYGGVVPELASRQHIKTIDYVVAMSLSQAGVSLEDIDLFAVTQGPGLIGSLLVGLTFAKGLAYYFHKPLIGVDHLQAHIEAAFLENPQIEYPVLALLVSGGHTSLYFLEKPLSYQLLGKTRDDAAGECLDKVAKFLQLGYPGGPVIERLARGGDSSRFHFSLPRMKTAGYDFSFSGLKTAALKIIRENRLTANHQLLRDFLASFEETVARALLENVHKALEEFRPAALVLCGGVARNTRLRTRFSELAAGCGLPSFVPSPRLCTDNAGMVGALAWKKYLAAPVTAADLELDAYPR
ncbi:MAG: tRNA (adenosine(37)-N6)-threonylcarbamoyltransferase complex transferase subunit TsaD [Candidatus Saccharicenans sp.]|jgi:N6-L-threonylcarbamoyladenine synthase|nr:tRNA (adenosine(37)-N6)-threonylcarbamoyltransferase complex transferase subunit TsaD [Candidatus Saccharicenans sp.]MDH7493805.1 tRNA (adenosine(37)-N6)-threonylcarbamoyltransferase complex transferase subunit TsaD [Candidatus Saccharicenans sp.]